MVGELTEWFERHDAISVTWQSADQQQLLEPDPASTPLWDAVMMTALYSDDAQIADLAAQLHAAFPQLSLHEPVIEQLADRPWEREWLERFKPMRFGHRLWICPTGHDIPQQAHNQVLVHLDPGLAFGTGTHPTTSLCLSMIDSLSLKGKSVIDYGCGSGILAIAAAKVGAAEVWAVDHDEQAIQSTRDNCAKNDVADRVKVLHSRDFGQEQVQSDVIIANILARPLMDLAEKFAGMIHRSGRIILSGILESQREEVIQAYLPWFDRFEHDQEEDWICLRGIRNP